MKTSNRCRVLWVVLASVAVFAAVRPSAGQSQITTGTIQGTVRDESGAVVPGAVVTIQQVQTGLQRRVLTDEQGRYAAPLLPVGNYSITVEMTGFARLIQTGITLALGQTIQANLTMKVASIQQVVTVSGEAPLVETSKSETSTLVSSQAIESLPLNGRRFLDLAFLSAGVLQERERGQLSFAGQRGINSNINIDGADFNNPFFGGQRGGERTNDAYVVSQEAIREFQVIRAGFVPEFGRSSGGIVNVVTKSGTNSFRGTAFYYLRHREFAPRTIFGDDTAPIRHQFGATFGGPLRRDRTFFFLAYDGQQQDTATVIRFSNPAGLPAAYLGRQGIFTSTNDVNTFLAKADHQLTAAHRLTIRYNYSSNDALNGTYAGGVQTGAIENNGTEGDRTHTTVVNLNTVFTARTLNEFRAQYSYENRPRVNNFESADFVPKAGPQTQVSGCCYFGGVSFLPVVQDDYRLQFAEAFSVLSRGHYIKIGIDWNRSHVDQIFRGNWRGVYIFNNVQKFVDVLNGAPGAVPDQFRAFFGPGRFVGDQYDVAGFVQDAWQIRRGLTITGGLRYEAEINPQPVAPNPLLPQSYRIPSDKREWQPRLGLSWDIFGTGRTVFRASSGLFYARTPMLLMNQAFNSNGNQSVGVSFTLNAAQIAQVQLVHPEFVYPFVPDTSKAEDSDYFTGAGIAGLKPDASFFADDFRNPRSFHATIGLEQLVARDFVLSMEWVHSNAVWLERIRDVNLLPPVLGLDTSTPPVWRPKFDTSRRPNPNFGVMRSQESSARSNYDAVTWAVNKRMSRHYQFLTSYTLSYNRDDDSNERNFSGIAYENAYDLNSEYSWSRNDIRHRWVFSGIFEAPWGVLVSGIASHRSGLPFSAFTGEDSNRDGQFTDKPVIAGYPLLRNMFRQPAFFQLDARVTKALTVFRENKLELIFDMFNLTNQVNFFYSVSTNESTTTALGSRWGRGQTPLPTFATIRLSDGNYNTGGVSLGPPFQLQVAVRYRF